VEIKFYGAFVLNRRVNLHAIDATPARWRGGAAPDTLVDFHAGGDHLRHECAPFVVADDALDGRACREVRVRGARARDAGHVVGRVLVDGRVRRAVRVAAVRGRRRALLGPVVGMAAEVASAVAGEGAGLDLRRLALRAVVGDAHFFFGCLCVSCQLGCRLLSFFLSAVAQTIVLLRLSSCDERI